MKKYLVLLLMIVMLASCQGKSDKSYKSSSVVGYLYPDKNKPIAKPTITKLALPIDVGVAFVPDYDDMVLSEEQKIELLDKVSAEFKKHKFIRNIEIIPSAYLTPKGGFDNLQQIKMMHDVDVMALVSYNQVQYTDDNVLSLAYWTIVGAYIFPGDKNDTSTMVDVAVFDIDSKKMLFRAPGTSTVKGLTTAIAKKGNLRKDSYKGFQLATDKLVVNLQKELAGFKEKVKKAPETYKVVDRAGYSGYAGANEWFFLGLMIFAGLCLKKKQYTS